ncbi:MAG: hypothetical protein CMK89_06640 [Pseudomonadales bacterium]|nr:hypothetical protein [Pseudomonadales bacterium]
MPKALGNRVGARRFWLLGYALLFAAAAQADTAKVPEAFWDYFIEYGDQQGEVFDPLDLAETEQAEQSTEATHTRTEHTTPNDNEEQAP